MHKSFLRKIKERIEQFIPMTFNSLVLFLIVIYLIFIVGKSVFTNYQSTKDIERQKYEIEKLEGDIEFLQFQIAYFKTDSFKEKEARAKLGYKLPGERVVSLEHDSDEDKVSDEALLEKKLKTPNPTLWWRYFFD